MKKIYLIVTLLLSVSCSNFLEPKSASEFVPKNIVSLNEMLISGAYLRGVNEAHAFLEAFSDDVEMTTENAFFSGSTIGDEVELHNLIAMTSKIQTGEYMFNITKSPWKVLYSNILYCNAALDYIPNVEGSIEMKNYVEAQALFMRALSYFYLVNYYGQPYNHDKKSLGVPLKMTSDLVLDMTPRNSVEEVYEQILSDLHASEKLWESIPDMQYKKNFRTNMPATQFLLSKVYLFMENWSEAKRYAELVMGWEQFTIYDLNTFKPSVESPSVNYATYNCPETIWLYGQGLRSVVSSYTLYTPKDISPEGKAYSRKALTVSSSLLSSYGEDDNDLRKELYMFGEWVTDGTPRFLSTRLPAGKIAHNPNMLPLDVGAKNPEIKFRLSEIYLIYAECCSMIDGKEGEAIRILNALRVNRIKPSAYKPLPAMSGSALLDFIKEERRREMCFEGCRWFDMRRWGMKSYDRIWKKYGVVESIYTISEKDNAFTMPLPKEAMDNNSALVQNPLSNRKID